MEKGSLQFIKFENVQWWFSFVIIGSASLSSASVASIQNFKTFTFTSITHVRTYGSWLKKTCSIAYHNKVGLKLSLLNP